MKRPLSLLLLSILLTTGCQSTGRDINNHWSERSVAPRAARFFSGYDASKDGAYIDFQWERKQSINLTLRRHFFNHNPDNPNHYEIPSRWEERPNHSILPNPLRYIHLEGILLGVAYYASTGIFYPLPLDSILGTLSPGPGLREFASGIGQVLTPVGVIVSAPFTGWTTEEGKAAFHLFDEEEASTPAATVVRVR